MSAELEAVVGKVRSARKGDALILQRSMYQRTCSLLTGCHPQPLRHWEGLSAPHLCLCLSLFL